MVSDFKTVCKHILKDKTTTKKALKCANLYASVRELYNSSAQLATKRSGQRQKSGGDPVLVHGRVVLQRAVHEPHDQVELLVLEHSLVADHVLAQFAAHSQPSLLGLKRPEHGREGLARVRDLVFKHAVDAVP